VSRRAPRPRAWLSRFGHHGREGGVHYCVLYNATGVREYPITLGKLMTGCRTWDEP
jgi:hypothetical protein